MAKDTSSQKVQKAKRGKKNDYGNVVWLGLTSLFTDVSTEMLTPILPLFLSSVLGASGVVIGLIEGMAKGSEHILSIFSGWISDRMGRRKPLAVFGYLLATVMKGAYAFAVSWEQLFVARLLDRSGKAIRNPPRDALLAESAGVERERRRTGFAIHRVLDTLGAILGPLVTIAFLLYIGVNIEAITTDVGLLSEVSREVFLLSLIPGIAAVVIIAVFVKEMRAGKEVKEAGREAGAMAIGRKGETAAGMLRDMFSISKYGEAYRVFLITSLLFYLSVPAMAFFYLKASDAGLRVDSILLMASFFSVTYIIGAGLLGFLSERIGDRRSKNVLAAAIAASAAIFFALALIEQRDAFILLFGAFGFVFGVLEVETRAYISSIVKERVLAGAFGTWRTVTGVSMIASGLLLGALWDISAAHMFATAAVIAFAAFIYFAMKK